MSGPSPYSFPPTPQNWIGIQDVVRTYYVDRKLPLKEVRTVLRDHHGFRATDRMIKARLKQWGYLKNAKREDWHFLALLHEQRRVSGHPSTVFDVRGHRKTVKDLHRFIRNQDMTPDEFLEEAKETAGSKQMPDYIQALTPDSRHYQESPPDEISLDYATPSPPTHPSQSTHHQNTHVLNHQLQLQWRTNHERMRPASASSSDYVDAARNVLPPAGQVDPVYASMPSNLADPHCRQMQMELEMLGSQIIQPVPLMSRIGDDDIRSWALLSSSPSNSDNSSRGIQFVCSRCNQPSDQHFISLDNFEPQHSARRDILNGDDHTLHLPVSTKEEGSWLWVSRCFLACMCLKKGDEGAAEQCLREASREFERLLAKKDRQLLTAAGLVMTVLHMHDQGDVVQKVIGSAYEITKRVLANDDPIAVTIRYLTASAKIAQKEWGITSASLFRVYQKFLECYPLNHEYVIAARYNYSWMLKFEGKLEQAEQEAREVYAISCQTLGEIHMQSVTALAVIAGCIFLDEGRADVCISTYSKIIENASRSLGRHHPYTLEARRRLAETIIKHFGPNEQTLQLYKDVLWGRVHMLGPGHQYTQGARVDYEKQLQTLGLWTDPMGQPTSFHQEVVDLFSPDSPGSWTKISRRRTMSQPTRNLKNELGMPNLALEEEDDFVMIESKTDGSQSPRSNHEFEAY